MNRLSRFICFAVLCVVALLPARAGAASRRASSIIPENLTCEYAVSPLIDVPQPRMAWVNANAGGRRGAAQTAYRIRVALSEDQMDAPLWDTGVVESAQSVFVSYEGPELMSRTDYWWQVMVWDEQGRASEWSRPACWHTGMLSADDWRAEWIGVPWQGEESYDAKGSRKVEPAPMLRREFEVSKPVRQARFYGTGLGWFELYMNGKRVGNEYFTPNQTNYDYRPKLDSRSLVVTDPFEEYTVMYVSYDLTDMIRQGTNAVGALLGNGFYDVVEYWVPQGYGSPRFIGQIEILYEDGTSQTVVSDTGWKAERSAIVSDQVYFGEHYDARLEHDGWALPGYDDSGWRHAAARRAPCGKLIAQNGPSDRITRTYAPVKIERTDGGAIRVSFPEEISGWVALKNISAEKGRRIEIKYLSESFQGTNSYTARGGGDESYHARFTWFVFSEAEITGLDSLTAEQVEAHAVNSDVQTAGRFVTSNGLINRINAIWQRSQLDNMHGGIASDCPHRERAPYTGDAQVACVTVMHNFDARTFYNKWLRDIRGAQTMTGYVPNAAPWQPGCGGGVGWGAAMEIMPWEFYRHYGDRRVLEQNFGAMCRHVRWMNTWVKDDTGIMQTLYAQKFKNLGDWLPPRELPRTDLVHTFYLWLCSDIVARTAEILGEDEAAAEFGALRDRTAEAFHREFYDSETGSYGKYGSNVLALRMGVPAERRQRVVEALRQNIAECNDHLDTGIVGTRYLFEVLCDNGLADLAYKIINQRDFPGYGWWIEQGATVTWENWNGRDSRNHPMFGGGLVWFYRDLAGLRAGDAGFRSFDIRPVVPKGLEWVEYSHQTAYGPVVIRWENRDGCFSMNCSVPVGCTATVWIPFSGDVPKIKSASGAHCSAVCDGYALYDVESGEYVFKSVLR